MIGTETNQPAAARAPVGPGATKRPAYGIAAAVEVTEHGLAEIVAGPVGAGQVEVAGERAALHVGSRQDVMLVGLLADASLKKLTTLVLVVIRSVRCAMR